MNDQVPFYENIELYCELCRLVDGEVKTRLYYRDDRVVIVDCLTCGIPMLVFGHHGETTDDEKRYALNIINQLFEYESIRTQARKIRDHEHWHIINGKLKEVKDATKTL